MKGSFVESMRHVHTNNVFQVTGFPCVSLPSSWVVWEWQRTRSQVRSDCPSLWVVWDWQRTSSQVRSDCPSSWVVWDWQRTRSQVWSDCPSSWVVWDWQGTGSQVQSDCYQHTSDTREAHLLPPMLHFPPLKENGLKCLISFFPEEKLDSGAQYKAKEVEKNSCRVIEPGRYTHFKSKPIEIISVN